MFGMCRNVSLPFLRVRKCVRLCTTHLVSTSLVFTISDTLFLYTIPLLLNAFLPTLLPFYLIDIVYSFFFTHLDFSSNLFYTQSSNEIFCNENQGLSYVEDTKNARDVDTLCRLCGGISLSN